MLNIINRTTLGRMAGVAALVATLGLTGCELDELLEVEDPEVVSPGTLEDPDLLPIVVAGAQNDFTGAFSGGESYVSVSALITDEYYSAGTFTTRTATDRRNQFPPDDGNTSDGTYNALQFARRALADAADKVAEFEGIEDEDFSELKTKEGYTKVLLAEGWCPNIPLSFVDETGEFVFTEGLSGAAVLDSAITDFNAALDAEGDDFAAVGKGRALLDLGRYDEAAAAVAGVNTQFVELVFHSVSGISNGLFALMANGRYGQANNQGNNGLLYRTANDPRTPWFEVEGGGFDAGIPMFFSERYTDFDNPVVLASGVEARLIEAEAALNGAGGISEMTAILNDLREQADVLVPLFVRGDPPEDPELAPLDEPATMEEAVDLLFSERAFWLYLTGHRLGDLRRLIYQYGRTEDEVYPTGAYYKGGDYGDDVVFPIDFDESNNELFELADCNVLSADIQ